MFDAFDRRAVLGDSVLWESSDDGVADARRSCGESQASTTAQANKEHRKFPYLLRGLSVNRVNQVWATDITYVPLSRGFMYLVAVID